MHNPAPPLHSLDTRLTRAGQVFTVSGVWWDGTIEITPGEWCAPTGPVQTVSLDRQRAYTVSPAPLVPVSSGRTVYEPAPNCPL